MEQIILLLGFLALYLLIYFSKANTKGVKNSLEDPVDMDYQEFISRLEKDEVISITERSPYLYVMVEGESSIFRVRLLTERVVEDVRIMGLSSRNSVKVEIGESEQGRNFTPYLILFGIIALFLFYIYRLTPTPSSNSSSSSSGVGGSISYTSTYKPQKLGNVSFRDVAGIDEAKEDLEEVVDFLKSPAKYSEIGAKLPKGILIVGSPGTGKTLLAKAIASEASVPFYSVSGSEFEEVYVGVGAARIRKLFEEAKRNAPCIVFIDEIDAVARQRSGSNISGSASGEQTLNQLLVEMDGFDNKSGVVIIGATNRADVLDKAVIRPGRFDRTVTVGMPTMEGREQILKVHTRGKKISKDADLKKLAARTVGLAGADLANIMNEAAINAVKNNRRQIENIDIDEAADKIFFGPKRKGAILDDEEKRTVAYHEAGHALVNYLLGNLDPVQKVTILPTGHTGTLGYTYMFPENERHILPKSYYLYKLQVYMGGRAAEEIVFDRLTSGANGDLSSATSMARDMIERLGMSEKIGVRAVDKESIELSKDVEDEITKLLNESYEGAKKLLVENRAMLDYLSNVLLEKEEISGKEMKDLLKKFQKRGLRDRK